MSSTTTSPSFRKPPFGNMPSVTNVPMALLLLFCLFAFFVLLTPLFTGLLGKICHKPEAVLRIAMIMQDIFVFILPAIVTALLCTRMPARLLAVDERPDMRYVILSLAGLIVSIPAMNALILWNENLHFPESLQGVEQMARNLEENAKAVTDSLMAGATIPSLIVSVMIVGVFAGFSEELFFRGALQRLLGCTMMNRHAVIWLVAVIFSLFHFQFFGFFPRMILGAYFGYLLLWTRSLWIPVIVHVFNNSMVVISTWQSLNNDGAMSNLDSIGVDDGPNLLITGISLILTFCVLRCIRHLSQKRQIN